MNTLIIDAVSEKVFLVIISNKNIYTSIYKNSKSNFDKLTILIDRILNKHNISINQIKKIYVNRGPGSFAGIRNSLSVVKAIHLVNKVDYYCFSFSDFKSENNVKYENIPFLCEKFKVKKNLINPIYLS